MATVTTAKVVMSFIDEDERDMNVTLNYAKTDVTSAAVKNLMDTMIQKAECFQRPPYRKTGAKLVTTTSTDIDVSN